MEGTQINEAEDKFRATIVSNPYLLAKFEELAEVYRDMLIDILADMETAEQCNKNLKAENCRLKKALEIVGEL